jgi:hypothetical protein
MRERRWESAALTFDDVLAVGRRLARRGLAPAVPSKEIIGYVEEWTVATPAAIAAVDRWPTEDVTLVHSHERWRGDFYLFAGQYHTLYRQLQTAGAYCSVSHPWQVAGSFITLHPRGMFWVGVRDTHAFVRVRLHTTEVVTPGETRADDRRDVWIDERRQAFESAIGLMDLPLTTGIEKARVIVRSSDEEAALFCSWPDAFGPCQFEFNQSDARALLVRAGQLAATIGAEPVTVRSYLTGFSESALAQFAAATTPGRSTYRCSVHLQMGELPEMLTVIAPDGRLYATLCEFQAEQLGVDAPNAWAIIGIVGLEGHFRIEARLNRAPLPEQEMAGWLEQVVGVPMAYAPLSPFP